jgi:predicted phosphoribosyltransferase
MKFADRAEAGRLLAGRLMHLKARHPFVLALPRGGVAVGFEVARTLAAPLDIVLVRKIGVPWHPELALGAVTDGPEAETFIDAALAKDLPLPEHYAEEETAYQLAEIARRRIAVSDVIGIDASTVTVSPQAKPASPRPAEGRAADSNPTRMTGTVKWYRVGGIAAGGPAPF